MDDWLENTEKELKTFFDGFCYTCGDTACVKLEGVMRCTVCGCEIKEDKDEVYS